MKPRRLWLAASLALLLSGCGGRTGPSPIESFQDWRDAIVVGNFEQVFRLMSPTMKSHWIYLIFKPNPRKGGLQHHNLATDYYRRLDSRYVPEFDAWLQENKMNYFKRFRVSPLPDTILSEPLTFSLLKEWFHLTHPHLKNEFGSLEVGTSENTRFDDNQATLIVRNVSGGKEFYVMILERGAWKVNYHRAGPSD